MKRLVPLFVAALFACGSHPSSPVAPTVAVTQEVPAPAKTGPIAIDHVEWNIVLPNGWKYDDQPELSDNNVSTRILKASSPTPIGALLVTVEIDVIQHGKGVTTEQFATAIVEQAENIVPRSTAIGGDVGELDGRAASLTFLTIDAADAGVVLLATGDDAGAGYVVMCSGTNLKPASKTAATTCKTILETFHVKRR